MTRIFLTLFLFFIVGSVQATEIVYPANYAPVDPELQNLQWNRYTTPNFVVLSIDDAQGKWLADNLEKIKTWCLTRWGFPDIKFSKECRVMCVPNRPLMKKLFNLNNSSYEIRRKDGKLEISVLWLILDDKPNKTIPNELTSVCLAEFEAQHNVKLGYYIHRGMSLLNLPQEISRQSLAALGMDVAKGETIFNSEKMFSLTEEEYNKLSPDQQKTFEQQSIALCLLLRKEFGEAKMQGFFRLAARNKHEDVMRLIYGFRDYRHFDQSYGRYMRDLTNDILQNKTPDSYLEIRPIR
jgi:hypothetical protein